MTRTEYLETIEGQLHERIKRAIKTVYLDIEQEPKSKNSTDQDKLFFRQEVKRQLKEMNRRPFRGDLILEIDYYTTRHNPPALQSLSKNYLDLLHKPMPHIDSYKGLLFHDDCQVKILISNYHLDEEGTQKPTIRITAYSFGNFIKDIELADRILSNDFADNDYSRHSRFRDDYRESYGRDSRDYYDDLKGLEKDKDFYLKKYGEQFYLLQKHFYTRKIQEQFLRISNFEIRNITSLFLPYFSRFKKYQSKESFQQLWSGTRSLVFFSSSSLDFGNPPIQEGDKTIFKKNLRQELLKFRYKYKILFPLLQPINVIITYLPPKRNVIDLDNLARYIVPFVNEIFEPPATFRLTFDNKYLNEFLKKEVNMVQRFPPNSIAGYQLISIPRKDSDPENGDIKFIITDGLYNQNIWSTVDDVINKWKGLY